MLFFSIGSIIVTDRSKANAKYEIHTCERKKQMKKILAIFLCLAMTAAVFVSCSKKEDTQQNKVADNEYTLYVQDLSKSVDFAGETFVFIGKDDGNFPVKDEETGDIGSDALYYRQRDLEDFFGISWEPVKTEKGPDTADSVINDVMAGGDSYDLVHGSTQTVGQELLRSGVVQSVDGLDYVDLSNEWWIEAVQTDYSIKGQSFFLTGPIVVSNYRDATCILFNKSVTAIYGINDSDLYNTVKEGNWTIDRMFEFASAVPSNTSGADGVYRYDEPGGYDFILTSGYKLTKFNEEGEPYVESALPREYSDLSDKLCPVFSDNNQSIFTNYKKGEDAENKYGVQELKQLFVNDHALFRFNYTEDALNMRVEEVEFGILPYPKRDDSQENYCSYARMGMDSAVYIPKSVKSIEMTDVITEAMGALSQYYVKNAYYEKLLKGQSVFDRESSDMLDIIFSTKVYDMIALYSDADYNQMGEYLSTLDNAIKYDNGNLASGYAGSAGLTNRLAQMLVKTVDKMG